MEWSDEIIGQLRGLWAEGLSTAEIGRRLGVTKNAIVGKAHRLDLPARPSPIRRDPDAAPVRLAVVRRVEGPTLPPLASTVSDGDQSFTVIGTTPAAPVQRAPAAAPRVIARPVVMAPPSPRPAMAPPRPMAAPQPRQVAAAPRPYGRIVTCCWPLGEPGTRDFHFCDVPSEPGRPYCEDHVKVAYVRVRDRREDAA
ncbi:MAG: GcrA cell cycle regulator [Acetobacteraceae bacterium]|nr:GcrA cell cycle regulator [Acetobacteraceae bacterium]